MILWTGNEDYEELRAINNNKSQHLSRIPKSFGSGKTQQITTTPASQNWPKQQQNATTANKPISYTYRLICIDCLTL